MPRRVRDIPGCTGCPMYQDGMQAFVPDEIVETAPVFILGQNPGEDEEREGRPFVGKTGRMMVESFFPLAELRRSENVSLGNAIRCRWQNSNDLPNEPLRSQASAHCQHAHFRVPSVTQLIVAQGAVAWQALGGKGSITQWRGYLKP